jgi:hypothetical protein
MTAALVVTRALDAEHFVDLLDAAVHPLNSIAEPFEHFKDF